MFRKSLSDGLLFIKKFLANPAVNGSLLPSSQVAGRSMFSGIDFDKINCVVELGPGLGTFTREYLKRTKPGTRVILFEVDREYRQHLSSEYGDSLILAEDAAALQSVVRQQGIERVDLIVSSLPFTLGHSLQPILNQVKQYTDQGAIFRFYTYAPFGMKQHYRQLPVKKNAFVLRNLPPMWIYGVN